LLTLWREEVACELDAELSARTGPILTVLSDDIILCLVGIRLIEPCLDKVTDEAPVVLTASDIKHQSKLYYKPV
jgi:hypothetical protein